MGATADDWDNIPPALRARILGELRLMAEQAEHAADHWRRERCGCNEAECTGRALALRAAIATLSVRAHKVPTGG